MGAYLKDLGGLLSLKEQLCTWPSPLHLALGIVIDIVYFDGLFEINKFSKH